ncbi:DUF3883 domain-containing protein [Actinoallomurus purpureus]|uniref:DUF3883 domain-containing protein n=1 Tax=Actinoallomurus purpureus TaxID=478114 RepID=UPI002092F5B2|nr:DUF3883 domain-containing protein [Actinoallomurus purpureus]MCO6010046.1 DUF3883 domain-containing protein [Actinoallomurus purpureus]
MRVMTDDGRQLDAEFKVEVEPEVSLLSLVLESSSGTPTSTDRIPRNVDYRPALGLLLSRLKQRDATLVAGLVDSERTAWLHEAERRFFAEPIRLAEVNDVVALRQRLGTLQGRVGQAPGASGGGNKTRRIRLRLLVPGYELQDAARLEADLAAPAAMSAAALSGLQEGHGFVETAVMMVHVPQTPAALLNLSVGMESNTWGFPGDLDIGQYEYVILGVGASPRVQLDEWLNGSATLYVCQAGAQAYRATAPHMPDEIAEGRVIWRTRIGIEPLGRIDDVPLGSDGPLSLHASDALRRSGTQRGFGRTATTDMTRLFEWMGLAPEPIGQGVPQVPLSRTRPVIVPPTRNRRSRGRSSGAGRQVDARKRQAIEQHAVELAKAHYADEGWEWEELGKPYDLRLTKPGAERHVEVKGTTGAPTSVELTANEVQHAREFPDVDLFVVSDITVTGIAPDFSASGGTVTVLADWEPAEEDLRPTRFEYRLPS